MNMEVIAATAAGPLLGGVTPELTRIGVIGAGQMGNGIAHVCALAGLPVTMLDVRPEQLQNAMSVMARNMERQVNRALISAEARDAALALVETSTDYAAFGDADLMIEAATEKEDVKHAVYKAVTPHLKPSCLIASNTSSISITRLGAGTDRPEKFIGMHFMNPGPGDEAGGDHPRDRHRRTDFPGGGGAGRTDSARQLRYRRISRPSSSTASWCR